MGFEITLRCPVCDYLARVSRGGLIPEIAQIGVTVGVPHSLSFREDTLHADRFFQRIWTYCYLRKGLP